VKDVYFLGHGVSNFIKQKHETNVCTKQNNCRAILRSIHSMWKEAKTIYFPFCTGWWGNNRELAEILLAP